MLDEADRDRRVVKTTLSRADGPSSARPTAVLATRTSHAETEVPQVCGSAREYVVARTKVKKITAGHGHLIPDGGVTDIGHFAARPSADVRSLIRQALSDRPRSCST
ncbi:MAG: hypothetical protein RL347_2012 [Actinomycetota bacterium]